MVPDQAFAEDQSEIKKPPQRVVIRGLREGGVIHDREGSYIRGRDLDPNGYIFDPREPRHGGTRQDSLSRGDLLTDRVADATDPTPAQTAEPPASSNSAAGDSCPGDPATGNPVKLSTGEKLKDEVDFVAGGIYGMSLVRTYRSTGSSNSLFGSPWRSSIDVLKLTRSTRICKRIDDLSWPCTFTLTEPDGKRFVYQYDRDTSYSVRGAARTGTLMHDPNFDVGAGTTITRGQLVVKSRLFVNAFDE